VDMIFHSITVQKRTECAIQLSLAAFYASDTKRWFFRCHYFCP
jgi:hypothetical protein